MKLYDIDKVFLGGTCNDSTWRDELIPKLDVDYFNPVVDDWNDEAKIKEEIEKHNAQFRLYVITPLMTGIYAIAEAVDDSNKYPERTLVCILEEDGGKTWSNSQRSSLDSFMSMVGSNGAKVFDNLDAVAKHLNSSYEYK